MKILIIDDSHLLRERLIELLSPIDEIETFIEAENSIIAKNILTELIPDIIITDIRMPGGSGIEFVRELRKHNLTTLVIVLTNYPYEQYETAAIDAGANYFFDKSNQFEKVKETISSLLTKIN